jgi:hypothetical protein
MDTEENQFVFNEETQEICRFCLKPMEDSKVDLTKLMEAEFYSLTGIQLEDEAIYSKQICDLCCHGLQYCNFLREKFIQSQIKLQKQVEQLESKPDIECKQEEEEIEEEAYFEQSPELEQYEEELVIEETVEQPIEPPKIQDIFPRMTPIREVRTLKIEPPKLEPVIQKPKIPDQLQVELQCDQCPFKTTPSSKESLEDHMRTHVTTVYKCSVCPRQFSDESALNKHSELMHQKQHVCSLCNQTFR